jgi:hypothetical protein
MRKACFSATVALACSGLESPPAARSAIEETHKQLKQDISEARNGLTQL